MAFKTRSHCQYAHRNNTIAVVGNNSKVSSNALIAVTVNSPKITDVTNGLLTKEVSDSILGTYPAGFALLAAEYIRFNQSTITRLDKITANENNETIQMIFSDGSTHVTNSILWRSPFNQSNTFAQDLGLAFNTNSLTLMEAVNGSTSVEGLYSADDASSDLMYSLA